MNEAQIQRMIQLKENFTGQQFQWIKTADKKLLGKVVECRDIQPGPGGTFVAHFSDGSKVDAGQINTKLMMLHGGVKPLTKSELSALNTSQPAAKKEPVPTTDIVTNPEQVGKNPKAASSETAQPKDRRKDISKDKASDMFAMFNTDETKLSLDLNIKLPDKKLLKMMYNSAEDKEEFVEQLSGYVYSQINKSTIKDSLLKTLEPQKRKKKKSSESGIKVTEVKDEDN